MTGHSSFLISESAKSSSAADRARCVPVRLLRLASPSSERFRQAVGHVDDEEDGVAGFEGVVDFLHHAAVELRVGLVHAGGVDQDDLGGGVAGLALGFLFQRDFEHAVDAGARGLRFVRDDGELLAEQGVEQRGFAGVGAADDGDET